MAPIHEGIGRRHFLRVFGTAAVAIAAGATIVPTTVPALAFNRHAFVFATRSLPPPLTCARVGDRLVFSPDVFGATDAQRLRAYVVMAEAEKAALDASWRGRTFMRPSA